MYTISVNITEKYLLEVVLAATYIYNRTSHLAIDNITPYEARYKKKPDVSNIKIWGSMVYSRTPNTQKLKLDEKSKRGILVGFGANQYKILDTTRNKTFWARDVIILEGRFKNLKSNPDLNSDSKHLELVEKAVIDD